MPDVCRMLLLLLVGFGNDTKSAGFGTPGARGIMCSDASHLHSAVSPEQSQTLLRRTLRCRHAAQAILARTPARRCVRCGFSILRLRLSSVLAEQAVDHNVRKVYQSSFGMIAGQFAALSSHGYELAPDGVRDGLIERMN